MYLALKSCVFVDFLVFFQIRSFIWNSMFVFLISVETVLTISQSEPRHMPHCGTVFRIFWMDQSATTSWQTEVYHGILLLQESIRYSFRSPDKRVVADPGGCSNPPLRPNSGTKLFHFHGKI